MKKIFRTALCSLALGATAMLSACSFIASDELSIASIDHERMDDGSTRITITYTDEDAQPTVFYIPAGAAGEKGNGISDVTSAPNADGTGTLVTISYTDVELPPTVLNLPYGTFISSVDAQTDPDTGDVTLTVNFSDSSIEPQVVTLRAGKDGQNGKDGETIVDIQSIPNADGSQTVVVELSTGTLHSFTIPAPQSGESGEDGRSIQSVTVNDGKTQADPNNIWLTVTYSDYGVDEIAVPKNNVWRNGEGEPAAALGNIGDYYLDKSGSRIYYKETGSSWTVVMDFSKYSEQKHTVYFVVDGNGTQLDPVQVQHGYHLNAAGVKLPSPTRPGYEFRGWFTSEDYDVNAGQFNDLTVVLADITLYARWVQV